MEIKLKPEHESKLKELGIYKKFIKNVENVNKKCYKITPMKYDYTKYDNFMELIFRSFQWNKSHEGHDFWSNISKQ
jgi:hypothetical protein